MPRDTVKLGPFPVGMDNRAPDFALPAGAFRDAVNVDLTNTGLASRRTGRSKVYSGTNTHSFWSNGDRAFVMDTGVLKEIYPDGSTDALLSGLSTHRPIIFTDIPGRGIGFTNGAIIRRIVGSTVRSFALASPQMQPTISVSSGGSVPAGIYQVACTFMDALGEESSAINSVMAEVFDGSILTVGLPAAIESEVTDIAVYLSTQNGSLNYQIAKVAVGTANYAISVLPTSGQQMPPQFLSVLPAGDLIAHAHGRVFTHRNGMVYYTEPWSGQYNPAKNYIPFLKDCSIIAPVTDGVYFVADQTYFAAGMNPNDWSLIPISNATGVRGTLSCIENSKSAMWFGSRGLAIGGPGGQIVYPQENHLSVDPAQAGAILYREQDGLRQSVAALRNRGQSVGGASSWFSAKLITQATRDSL